MLRGRCSNLSKVFSACSSDTDDVLQLKSMRPREELAEMELCRGHAGWLPGTKHNSDTSLHCFSPQGLFSRLQSRMQVEKPAEVQEIIGQKRLRDKVSGILERIEKELDSVESKIGEAMHVLDTDNDGMVRPCLFWACELKELFAQMPRFGCFLGFEGHCSVSLCSAGLFT